MSHDMFLPDPGADRVLRSQTYRTSDMPVLEWDADHDEFEFPDWYDQAACKASGTELFYPDRGTATSEAKRVCAKCPVRWPCLNYALDNGERFGIWGGYSERERRRMRKLRNQRRRLAS